MTTKLHLSTEQGQKPLSVVVTAGQRGDSPQFQTVLERIRVPRAGRGRARTRPDRVLADKAYGSRANRAYLRRRGIRCTIPEKADQIRHRKNRGSRGGRRPAFDKEIYKQRHSSGPKPLVRAWTWNRPRTFRNQGSLVAEGL
ncbi:transposase [Saccharopolyspora pogona]|uniref:transposase n=1 Tax=Saccharopolyspora pogona TaxID=333966 RepID=UPI0021DF6EA1|nr:transposase [Saccharopolyspora pogona]